MHSFSLIFVLRSAELHNGFVVSVCTDYVISTRGSPTIILSKITSPYGVICTDVRSTDYIHTQLPMKHRENL